MKSLFCLMIFSVTMPVAAMADDCWQYEFSPYLVEGIDIPGTANAIEVVDNLALMTDPRFGLRIVDVSTPATPVLNSELAIPGNPGLIAVAGNLVCVSGGWDCGLQAIDISNPAAPEIVGSLVGTTLSVAIPGNYAYRGRFQSLEVVNASAPDIPRERRGRSIDAVGYVPRASGDRIGREGAEADAGQVNRVGFEACPLAVMLAGGEWGGADLPARLHVRILGR